MSEPLNDEALEAAALAAMEPKAADAEQADADKQSEADRPVARIEDTAKKIGWAGKDEWKGDPDDWVDAPEFILKAAGEVLPSMRKSLEKANEEIKGLKGAVKTAIAHMSKADERAYIKARADLEAELEQYAEAGNAKAVKEVAADLVALDREAAKKSDEPPPADPDFAAWRAENDWYDSDPVLKRRFDALCEEVLEEGYTKPKVGLKEATARLKEVFPDKFKPAENKPAVNPNRSGPAAVEGGGGPRRAPGKSFSDMPREAQEMCLDLMKLSKAITKENYAAQHFASAAQEQRR